MMALWWGLKPTLVLDHLSSSLWYWQQATYAPKAPVSWVLSVLSFYQFF